MAREPEFTVIGDWIIRNRDGDIKHKVCGRWCIAYNNLSTPGSPIQIKHRCGSAVFDDDERDYDIFGKSIMIEIPEFVQLISQALRKT